MSSPGDATIIPITLTVNERTGLTLWAPPWEDDEGEEWQGFLGDGAKILVYPTTQELANFIASGQDNDLSDHPAWGRVLKLTPDQLKPDAEDAYNLDKVYDWASGEPDPVHVSALADVVDMVGKIADCCDDGRLRRLIENTPEYAELVDDDVSYSGREGHKAWDRLGDTIAQTWDRAVERVESWLSWQGDFDKADGAELAADSIWERVGAEPIKMRFPDATYLTVRADVQEDPDSEDWETVFLGNSESVVAFRTVADLARYCRTAKDHDMSRLEWWGELAEVDDDEIFEARSDASYDLRKPSEAGAELLLELADYTGLEADLDYLEDEEINRDDWRQALTEVRGVLTIED